MPFITIDTNSDIQANTATLTEAMEIVSLILNKPKDYIVIKINTGNLMAFGAEPENIGALIEVKSIGYNGKIGELAASLTHFCVKRFGAQNRYISIHFVDMPATQAAQNGRLFA